MSEEGIIRICSMVAVAAMFGPLFYWIGKAIYKMIENEKDKEDE